MTMKEMEEIRLGLLDKVDIQKYADCRISYEKMSQVLPRIL